MTTWNPDPAGGRRERRWDPETGWSLETRPAAVEAPRRSEDLGRAAELYEELQRAPREDPALRARLETALRSYLSEVPPPAPGRSAPPPASPPRALTPPPPGPAGPPAGAATAPPPRSSGDLKKVVGAAVIALAVGFAVGRAGVQSPEERMDELASQFCDAIDGESRLIGAGMIGFAVHQAEELGYSGFALGNRIEAECPFLYGQLTDG